MFHAIACLIVPKLSFLGEHSEVSQARSVTRPRSESHTTLLYLSRATVFLFDHLETMLKAYFHTFRPQ